MSKRIFCVAVLISVLLPTGAALAIDVQNFKPAIGNANLLSTYSSDTYAQGQFGFAWLTSYAADPFLLHFSDDEDLSLVDGLLSAELLASVGAFDWWEIGVAGAFDSVTGADLDAPPSPAFPENDGAASTMGDVRAMFKFRLLENKPGRLGIALVPMASFPTGDPDLYVGADAVTAGGRLVLDKRFGPVDIVINGGYVYLPDPDGADEGFDPTGSAEFGAGLTVTAHKYVELMAEIAGRTVDYGIDNVDLQVPTETLGAAKFYVGPVHFILGGGAGINAGIGNPTWRAIGGVAVTWPPLDRERTPARGAAPDDRVDDTDRDGLTNFAETDTYHTDPLNPDTDGDGLPDGDEIDRYHTDPLNADTDGDGLSDMAEVRLHGTDPLAADSDGDTLADGEEVNALRTNPNTADTDGDNIPDQFDGAPLEPETYNGYQDEDGVPEVVLARKPSGVMMFDNQFVVPAPFVFDGERGATLAASDQAMLTDVAQLLKEYPAVTIRIEGHVSAAVPNAQAISEARAAAVQKFLVKQGVAADRMEAVGLGGDVPVDTEDTAAGRAKNTRIDLLVTGR